MPPKARSKRARVFWCVVASVFTWLAVASPVLADETRPAAGGSNPNVAGAATPPETSGRVLVQPTAQPQPGPDTQPAAAMEHKQPLLARPASRPRGLLPLFASYAVVQALDVHSTLSAVHRGAAEANPFMAPLVNRPAAFVAFKAAITAGSIAAADRLSKHNRVAAYALMIGLNSAYAMIAVHNYRVANRQ